MRTIAILTGLSCTFLFLLSSSTSASLDSAPRSFEAAPLVTGDVLTGEVVDAQALGTFLPGDGVQAESAVEVDDALLVRKKRPRRSAQKASNSQSNKNAKKDKKPKKTKKSKKKASPSKTKKQKKK